MKELGFKNEKIFGYAVDFLIVTVILGLTWMLFGYPHIFPYFQQMEEAQAIISPEKYAAAVEEINMHSDRVLLEILFAYFLYESLFLIIAGTTPGRKLFGKKLVCPLGEKNKYTRIAARCLIFPARTATKMLFCYWMVPMLVTGGLFLLSKKDRTLLDIIFMTRLVRQEQ